MVTPAWGLSAERYEEMYTEVANRAGTHLASPVVARIEPGSRVLDLGCGTGWQARLLVEKGCTVVGVELDVRAAARATPWCERVVTCDLDVVDLVAELGPDRFDFVAAGDVLEHLRDPEHVLRAAAEFLRPGGRIVASVPNVAHGSVRLALLTGAFAYEDAGLLDRTHLRFFTLAGIESLFTAAGYTIDGIERTTVPVEEGTPYDRALLPPGIEEIVAAMPEATTFQFVVVAHPANDAAAVKEILPVRSERQGGALMTAQAEALRAKELIIGQLRGEVSGLESQLAQIRGSRLWRWSAWLRSPVIQRLRHGAGLFASRYRSSRS